MSNKYETLVNILDKLCDEAPPQNSRYYPRPDDIEGKNHARSRALIHLYLKVMFGILNFKDREHLITDGSQDGGIDAYYINTDIKKIYFIQSKFRTTNTNYENKSISLGEILNMDCDRITDGEEEDEKGNSYNGKIKQLQREIRDIEDIGRYSYEVIILANIDSKISPSQLRKLTGGLPTKIFDFKKTYSELVFPVVTGTFYNQENLSITLNLSTKSSSSARIDYSVQTEFENCDITVVFVPTEEIAKILHKYKNSILKYNPRCYLELQTNNVNKEIYNTITQRKTNEFSLYNNGITMLSDATDINEKIGQIGKAQIWITNPQIINGGQTAFTLSRIYEDVLNNKLNKDIFENKEVLLKIITFNDNILEKNQKIQLIESISKATNQQSQVSEADRRSNDAVQIKIQHYFFENFGIYYERKKGEYSDGLKEKYISRKQIVNREVLLRLAMACKGLASQARRSSDKKIFEESHFSKILEESEDCIYKYYYAYLCFQYLNQLEKEYTKDSGESSYGFGLRYGKYAIVTAITSIKYKNKESLESFEQDTLDIVENWKNFERHVASLDTNYSYFYEVWGDKSDETSSPSSFIYNFDGYYKGRTINSDLKNYLADIP
ncbi:AIPR family protein [Eikenella corrodens]|uniref:Abortive phage infection protein C-terminal domain-containing protein n=1 Tax=Eikenella corrodens CC92I TaxID=1073362 RepID=V7IEM9_EIKCO|nr:AIPR family protein [Eikenella corrodens]ETA83327.1 hypothetical protein HMPREF1177_01488 [Eikenella corrodens CC92I]